MDQIIFNNEIEASNFKQMIIHIEESYIINNVNLNLNIHKQINLFYNFN